MDGAGISREAICKIVVAQTIPRVPGGYINDDELFVASPASAARLSWPGPPSVAWSTETRGRGPIVDPKLPYRPKVRALRDKEER